MGLLAISLIAQVVVITAIVFVLKKKLNDNLNDLAISQLEAGRLKLDGSKLIVKTHQPVSQSDKQRILKAIAKNMKVSTPPVFQIDPKLLGGMIITTETDTVDYSLVDRLRKAR